MKIIINGRFLLHQTTGVERYAREILAGLDKIVGSGILIMAVPPEVKTIPVYKNIQTIRIGRLHNRLWEHISFPLYVKKKGGIPLNLCNVAPLLSPGIVCLFDMKIKVHPEFFSKKFLIWYNILFYNATKRARLILTDSESAKQDILTYYPFLDRQDIHVIYPAWQHYNCIGYDENTLSKYKLEINNYYFAMGSMEPNKNFKWIAQVARNTPSRTFAISGSLNEKVFANGLGFECPSNMKLLGYVSDEEAKTLMRDCKAFLFPSFHEGFGIPPLEAISAGAKHIIVSDIKVMHEVFGDNVTYINPNNYNYCLDNFMEKKYPEDVLVKYSWEKSARKLNALLVKVVEENTK